MDDQTSKHGIISTASIALVVIIVIVAVVIALALLGPTIGTVYSGDLTAL